MVFQINLKNFAVVLFALSFVSVSTAIATGQESPDQGFKRELEENKVNPRPDAAPAINLSLDQLFVQLKREPDSNKAKRIAQKIWNRWAQSGSETVDVLMTWASIAMKDKNWSTATDLLDQVIVIAPQYAEGWNRRATLYFLRGEYGRSIHDIEQVLKLESRHFGAMAGMGNILQRLDKTTDNERRSLTMWKKVLELYPAHKNAQKSVTVLEEKLSGHSI